MSEPKKLVRLRNGHICNGSVSEVINRLRAEKAELLERLVELEWSGTSMNKKPGCPVCKADAWYAVHEDGCTLNATLNKVIKKAGE